MAVHVFPFCSTTHVLSNAGSIGRPNSSAWLLAAGLQVNEKPFRGKVRDSVLPEEYEAVSVGVCMCLDMGGGGRMGRLWVSLLLARLHDWRFA